MLLIFLATLPFIHDIFPADSTERFMGFRNTRIFLYAANSNIFSLIGWYLVFILAKEREFRFAILVPLGLQAYQTAGYVFNIKKTHFFEFEFKFAAIIIAAIFFTILFFRGKTFIKKQKLTDE